MTLTAERIKAHMTPFEGNVAHMYVDTVAKVTVGIGNMLPNAASAQQLNFVGFEIVGMTDPDVEIGAFRLRDGAARSHQEEAVNAPTQMGFAVINEAACEALGAVEIDFTRRVFRQPRRSLMRDITRQHRMIDMKEQRQQFEKNLLAHVERGFSPGHTRCVDLEKPLLDQFERFAIDAVVERCEGLRVHACKYRRRFRIC